VTDFPNLNALKTEEALSSMSKPLAIEVQTILKALGYYFDVVDGIAGKNTHEAFAKFKADNYQLKPHLIGGGSAKLLIEKYNARPQDFTSRLKEQCEAFGLKLNTQIAYILATVFHETNGTMEPVREAYWLTEKWRKQNLRYFPFYGRGLSQITWRSNYEKFSKILGVDLVTNPDVVLRPDISLKILVYGFKHGTFTGHKLEDHVNATKTDFINARRCINGTDKASLIEGYAFKYLSKL